MTSAEAPKRLYIPQPFASAQGAALTAIEAVTSNNVNFADGFPSVYEAPSSSNGKFVTRGEMNAIGYLASVNEFARACGGIVTFDQRLAKKIGGYFRGAVLEFLNGLNYARVVSLVDNNIVDFTGTEIDTTIPDNPCVSGSVDGVNWAFCEQGVVPDFTTIMDIPNLEFAGDGIGFFNYIGVFAAPSDGTLQINGDATITATTEVGTDYVGGLLVVVAPFDGNTPPPSPMSLQYDELYSRGNILMTVSGSNIQYKGTNAAPINVSKGTKYAVYAIMQYATLSNSKLRLVIR